MIITVAGIDNTVTTNSLGIQAVSDGLLTRLKNIFPDARIIRHLKDYRISKEIWSEGDRVDQNPPLYRDYFYRFVKHFKERHPERVRNIQASDRLIICGDGIIADLFPQWCLVLAAEASIAMENGIPFVTLDQSVNVSRRSLAGFAVEHVFLKAPVSVRELDSIDVMKRTFQTENVHLAIDTAFLVDPVSEVEKPLYDQYLKTLKGQYGFSEYLLFSARGKRPSHQPIDPEAWAVVLRRMAEIFDLPVVFASTCPAEDIAVAREIKKRFKPVILPEELLDSGKYDYRFFLHLSASSTANLSDRYHQNVFSLLSNTPFLPVEGNTSKSKGLIEMVQYPFEILPLITMNRIDSFLQALNNFSSRYQELQHFLIHQKQIRPFDRYREFLT